jgi:hypothetical protein
VNGAGLDSKLARMGIVFTWTICKARVARTFTRRAHEKGVVIVLLESKDGCMSTQGCCMHLIADNLGWFEDNPVNVENLVACRGEAVQRLIICEKTRSGSTKTPDQCALLHEVVKTDNGETIEVLINDPSISPNVK